MVSIADKVAEMMSSDEVRQKIIDCQKEVIENITRNNDTYGDIFDGQIFKDLYNSQAINTDQDIINIYLKIDIDGFTSSSSHSSMIMIHAVVLNLDSSERYINNKKN